MRNDGRLLKRAADFGAAGIALLLLSYSRSVADIVGITFGLLWVEYTVRGIAR